MAYHMRPGANYGHIAYQHIKKLGKLIQTGFSQNSPDPGNPVIIPGGLLFMGITIDQHASELITFKVRVIMSCAQLDKENRAF